jgi:hypothetical protein
LWFGTIAPTLKTALLLSGKSAMDGQIPQNPQQKPSFSSIRHINPALTGVFAQLTQHVVLYT